MSGFENDTLDLDQDPTPQEEQQALEEEGHRGRKLANDLRQQDLEQRRQYAERAYSLTQTWVGFIVVVTLAQIVLGALDIGRLGQPEFIAVITTTTAAILGFWALVGRGLYQVYTSPAANGSPKTE